MTVRRPAVTLKLAQTADGFVAGGAHDPRLAITGVAANGAVHVMRAMHDAIMVGIGTALADDPLMTVRLPGLKAKPLRVVLDGALRLTPASRLVQTAAEAPILVLTRAENLASGALRGIDGLDFAAVRAAPSGRLDLADALRVLAERGVTRVFSEGGPTLGSALVAEGLADDVLLFRAPRPLGHEGVPALSAAAWNRVGDPAFYRLTADCTVGVDRLQHYERVEACSPD